MTDGCLHRHPGYRDSYRDGLRAPQGVSLATPPKTSYCPTGRVRERDWTSGYRVSGPFPWVGVWEDGAGGLRGRGLRRDRVESEPGVQTRQLWDGGDVMLRRLALKDVPFLFYQGQWEGSF